MAKRVTIPRGVLPEFKRWCCAKGGTVETGGYGEAFRIITKKGIFVFYSEGGGVTASGRALKAVNKFMKEMESGA